MRTRGEGVQNPENFADVIYGWYLTVLQFVALRKIDNFISIWISIVNFEVLEWVSNGE